jgi:hypothetical protein
MFQEISMEQAADLIQSSNLVESHDCGGFIVHQLQDGRFLVNDREGKNLLITDSGQ